MAAITWQNITRLILFQLQKLDHARLRLSLHLSIPLNPLRRDILPHAIPPRQSRAALDNIPHCPCYSCPVKRLGDLVVRTNDVKFTLAHLVIQIPCNLLGQPCTLWSFGIGLHTGISGHGSVCPARNQEVCRDILVREKIVTEMLCKGFHGGLTSVVCWIFARRVCNTLL
ncbi:hypothetical protein I7I50_02152 [Histoplasma capsulatum G186AR]|uniref:Uncharacterized protein n=1 Tax=Ajellomyces capsulatus TaxID=5037 RepID=A0A8H7YAC9_AJECA|nr:hypothetical protein I7I52_12366 [Histoplasma capsulatum]QSS71351.1 hypothetical protein I7I50_02152 [Histoplasma capsulatum G186AR]